MTLQHGRHVLNQKYDRHPKKIKNKKHEHFGRFKGNNTKDPTHLEDFQPDLKG